MRWGGSCALSRGNWIELQSTQDFNYFPWGLFVSGGFWEFQECRAGCRRTPPLMPLLLALLFLSSQSRTWILFQSLATLNFSLLILFIHIPQKCTWTLSTWHRSSPSAGDTQYSHFVLKWPNWLEIMLQWHVCRQAAGVNRSSPFSLKQTEHLPRRKPWAWPLTLVFTWTTHLT